MNLRILVVLVILTTGCATVHNGRYQEISVVTDPAGATVDVRCGKSQPMAMTPATIRLPRRVDECSLTLTRAGFRSETVRLESSSSGWAWGNFAGPVIGGGIGATRQSDQAFVDFLLGALIGGAGFGIDAMSGAMWELEPARIELRLTPEATRP